MAKSRYRSLPALILAAALGLAAPTARAASVVISLGSPHIAANTATFDIGLSFTGDPGDVLEAVQLSVVGSSSELTVGGTDYSRFSFLPSLAGWSATPFDPNGFNLVSSDDPTSDLGPTSQILLGQLVLDLAGIDPATLLTLTLSGGTPGVDNTIVSGIVGGQVVTSETDPTLLSLRITPDQVQFQAVPEPSSLTLGGIALVVAGGLAAGRSSHLGRRRAG